MWVTLCADRVGWDGYYGGKTHWWQSMWNTRMARVGFDSFIRSGKEQVCGCA